MFDDDSAVDLVDVDAVGALMDPFAFDEIAFDAAFNDPSETWWYENQTLDSGEFADVFLTAEDLGIDPDAIVSVDDFVVSGGLEVDYVVTDDGSIVSVDGELVAPAEQTWAESFYIDEDGNVRDWSGAVVASRASIEAGAAANPKDPTAGAVRAVAQAAVQQSGQTRATSAKGEVSENRRAGTPPAAATTKTPETTLDRIERWVSKVLDYDIKKSQLEAQKGQPYRPSYATSRVGTPIPQQVGAVQVLSDGRRVENLGNGTARVSYPDGRSEVISTRTANAAQSSGFFSGTTGVLIVGGLGVLALLALSRRGAGRKTT